MHLCRETRVAWCASRHLQEYINSTSSATGQSKSKIHASSRKLPIMTTARYLMCTL